MKMSCPDLFGKLANEIIRRRNPGAFDAQHIANIVWSYSTVRLPNPALYDRIAEEIVRCPPKGFQPQNISNIAWAFGASGLAAPRESQAGLFDKMASKVVITRNPRWFKP